MIMLKKAKGKKCFQHMNFSGTFLTTRTGYLEEGNDIGNSGFGGDDG